MSWTRPIDAYCERVGPEFWAEPVNAVTNAAFVAVGLVALAIIRRQDRRDSMASVLAAITTLVGIGSFLFHTVATAWAGLADALPISLFILAYFGGALHRFAGLGPVRAVLATAAFLAASMVFTASAARLFARGLNGSESYLPALLALLGIGLWLARRRHPAAPALLTASALFAASIVLRTIDMAVCSGFPLGTHFLWHLLNAAVLGTLLAAFIAAGPRATEPRSDA